MSNIFSKLKAIFEKPQSVQQHSSSSDTPSDAIGSESKLTSSEPSECAPDNIPTQSQELTEGKAAQANSLSINTSTESKQPLDSAQPHELKDNPTESSEASEQEQSRELEELRLEVEKAYTQRMSLEPPPKVVHGGVLGFTPPLKPKSTEEARVIVEKMLNKQ